MKNSILVLLGLLLVASSALAGGFQYSCSSISGGGSNVDVDVTMNTRTIRVHSDQQGMGALRFTARRALKYKPKGNPNKVAFKGEQQGNSRMVVASKEMLLGGLKLKNGKRGGFIQIRGNEDSYWSSNYVCYAR